MSRIHEALKKATLERAATPAADSGPLPPGAVPAPPESPAALLRSGQPYRLAWPPCRLAIFGLMTCGRVALTRSGSWTRT